MSSTEFNATTKSALSALVEREAKRVGSRCVAFENVASTIGMSSSWIRKFLTYDDAVAAPRMPVFQNIKSYYDSVCERVETDNRKDEVRLKHLKGAMHAVTEGIEPQNMAQDKIGMGEG